MKIRSADEIYRDYEGEVLAILPSLEVWWNSLAGKTIGDTNREDRWPMGPISHPRFIAIFRRYFIEILNRNQLIEDGLVDTADTSPTKPEEDLWGIEDSFDDYMPDLIRPQMLLIEQLAARRPELIKRIKYFVYIPIGGDDEPEPSEVGGRDGSS
jgi:hypothetical protein